jgi:hypothetical protein
MPTLYFSAVFCKYSDATVSFQNAVHSVSTLLYEGKGIPGRTHNASSPALLTCSSINFVLKRVWVPSAHGVEHTVCA